MFGRSITEIAEVTGLLIMLIGVISITLSKSLTKDGLRRAIQFLAVILVIPTIFILALEKILSAETTGTLLGALIGYLLSGLGAETPWKSTQESQQNVKQKNE